MTTPQRWPIQTHNRVRGNRPWCGDGLDEVHMTDEGRTSLNALYRRAQAREVCEVCKTNRAERGS